MKKGLILLPSVITLGCTPIFSLNACRKNDLTPREIGVTFEGIELGLDQTKKLTALVLPHEAEQLGFVWSSESPDIAEVDNTGLITAHKPGFTTISVHPNGYDNLQANCLVSVVAQKGPSSVKILPEKLSLNIGDTYELLAQVEPQTAQILPLQWRSDNEDSVIFREKSGSRVVIECKLAGKAEISVWAVGYDKIIGYCNVQVNVK